MRKPRLLRWPWVCLFSGIRIFVAGCFVLDFDSHDLRLIVIGLCVFLAGLWWIISTRD